MVGKGGGAPGVATGGWPSASSKSRPTAIRAPRNRKKFVVTAAVETCSGEPSSLGKMALFVLIAAKSSNMVLAFDRKSMKSALEMGKSDTLRFFRSEQAKTRRSGFL